MRYTHRSVGFLEFQMTYSLQEYQKVSRREKNVVIRQNGSNRKKLLPRKLDAIPICVCKVTGMLCVIVLSSEPNTRISPSVCLRTELPTIGIVSFLQQFWGTAFSGFTANFSFKCPKNSNV